MKRLLFLAGGGTLLFAGILFAEVITNGRGFRFAISQTLIAKNVTAQETKQAMDTWAAEFKRQVSSFKAFEFSIAQSNEIPKQFRNGELDGVVVTPFEYPSIAQYADPVAMTNEAAPSGEEYLVLVHRDSGFRSISDLKGRKIAVYDHPKMNVARMWLDSVLANAGFGPHEAFFGSVTSNPKLNLTVLAVFFKTTDACLVAKRSFNLMMEMNPQLGTKLQALASSPQLVSAILVFRKDCPQDRREDFQRAMEFLKTAPAGQQALALFDGTGLVRRDVGVLKPALDLIAAHERLRPKPGGGK